jgi:hypothetical protein
MIGLVAIVLLGCTPNPGMRCTRTYDPVCAEGTEYSNLCHAQAAGYVDDCAFKVSHGPCNARDASNVLASCGPTEFLSVTGVCVEKPWSDFESCEMEKNQGACPDGYDPNPWVGEHCVLTCASH